MKLNHIDLQVSNVEAAREFFEREGGPNLFFVCEGPDAIPVEIRAPRDGGDG